MSIDHRTFSVITGQICRPIERCDRDVDEVSKGDTDKVSVAKRWDIDEVWLMCVDGVSVYC